MYQIKISSRAKKDIEKLKQSSLFETATDLVIKIKANPFVTPPPYEKLEGYADTYSRRINKQHRLIYSVDKQNSIIYVRAAWSHYE